MWLLLFFKLGVDQTRNIVVKTRVLSVQVAERPLKKMVNIFVSYCGKLDWNDNYAQVGLDSLHNGMGRRRTE